MTHDLSLGPPVETERDPDAKHAGPCFDGVYGCHLCWNAANDGKGTISTCSRCRQEKFTVVRRAHDEPVMYEACADCCRIIDASVAREAEEDDARHWAYLGGDHEWEDHE